MSKVRLVFIGTGGSTPSKKRGLPAVAIKYMNKAALLDCGEGCQYRFFEAGLGLNKVRVVLITHMHGDHVLGLPGLIQTLAFMGREEKLTIIGPEGIRKFLEAVLTLVPCNIDFGLEVIELRDKEHKSVYEDEVFEVSAVQVDHTIVTYAYRIVVKEYYKKIDLEKVSELGLEFSPELMRKIIRGQVSIVETPTGAISSYKLLKKKKEFKIVYSGDTRPCSSLLELAREVDVLIHDATFSSDLKDKAVATGHSTAADAALIAKTAKVKNLILFHISARYTNASQLLVEAAKIFPQTILPSDMDEIEFNF